MAEPRSSWEQPEDDNTAVSTTIAPEGEFDDFPDEDNES
jgi:hypothetical protein